MLKQRIITAAWLAPLVLFGLFGLEGQYYALFTALIVLLATWEWSNLAGIKSSLGRAASVAGMMVLMLLLWRFGGGKCNLAFVVERSWLVGQSLLGNALSAKGASVAVLITAFNHGVLGFATVLGWVQCAG